MARGVYKVTVKSERSWRSDMEIYTGAAGNAQIAVRKALRCAKKDDVPAPYVSELDCIGNKDF